MSKEFEINTKYEHTFSVRIDSTTKRQFFLDKNSPIKGFKILYVKTRRGDGTNKSLQGETIVPAATFTASFLVLKVRQTEVLNKIPLEYLENSTTQVPALGYPIFLQEIDFEQSYVEVATGVTLTADQVFEFTFTFLKQ